MLDTECGDLTTEHKLMRTSAVEAERSLSKALASPALVGHRNGRQRSVVCSACCSDWVTKCGSEMRPEIRAGYVRKQKTDRRNNRPL